MAAEANEATAAWCGTLWHDGGDGSALAADGQGDDVLRILLAARQKCLRDPTARHALLQLHARAGGNGGGQRAEGWQQQLGLLFADGGQPKQQPKEGANGATSGRGASG
jgi:hypothetical protein